MFYKRSAHRERGLGSMELLEMAPSTNRITVRLPNSLLAELKKEANERDLPVSSLLVKILNKNVSFDRRIKSIPTIIMSQTLFMTMIENMTQSTINKTAKTAPKIVKKLSALSGWKYEIDSIIEHYFLILTKYCGWFQFKYETNHTNYTLIFETYLGTKWTKFLSIYVRSILESLKIHVSDESIDDGVIIFKFVKH